MTRSGCSNPITKKQDIIHLAILLAIALGIGAYLIATTVLISRDGVFYIQLAKQFSSEPGEAIKGFPFGYPLLIFSAHKLVSSLGGDSSSFTWIYSAQGVTLLCRLLALIPLYFIGKILVGSKRSFLALFILIILPYPAEFANDILRDWPNVLFLASGFLFLIWGAERNKWWLFAAAGFAAGLGHVIRPECAQLLVYGVLWIFIRLLRPKPPMTRTRLVCALFALLIGFAIPAAPYMTARGKFIPAKLKALISSIDTVESEKIRQSDTDSNSEILTASGVPVKIAKAIGKLAGVVSEDLMYFFVPPLLIGMYFRFRNKSPTTEIERIFIPAFVSLNIVMLIILYYTWDYLSRRHGIPLVIFTIFYVPVGLEVLAGWLAERFSKSRPATDRERRRWFFILLITGTIICIPKLLQHSGTDKQGIRTAAAWLKENTVPEDRIASPDSRIPFYAERQALVYKTAPRGRAEYVVTIVKDENQVPDFVSNAQIQYSVWENERRKNKKIVIYKMPLYKPPSIYKSTSGPISCVFRRKIVYKDRNEKL